MKLVGLLPLGLVQGTSLLLMPVCPRVFFSDSISAFAWEPVGHRFAVIHGDSPRIAVSFYNVKTGAEVELISKRAALLSLLDGY